MPYASPSDLLQRYDARLVGDLVSDNGVKVAVGELPTNAVLLAVIADAGAAVDGAVYVGNRFTPAQMADLSPTSAAFIRRLVCDLSLIYLKRRRGLFDPEKDGALLKEVNDTLGALRDGKDMLLLTEQVEAPASTIELVRTELITVGSRRSIQSRTQNYYPNPRIGWSGNR